VTKLAGEHYCRVFAELYGLETVALRYFNVYGSRQRPDSAYAAVIPLFIDAMLRGEAPTVHGDGTQSRDFTFVDDVVRANLRASEADAARCSGHVYNIAGGVEVSLLDILASLSRIFGLDVDPVFTEPRAGDVHRSLGDASAAARDLDFRCEISFEDGLRRTVEWLRARA
jgi:nucleoside-diphosphate-sugar epimerase